MFAGELLSEFRVSDKLCALVFEHLDEFGQALCHLIATMMSDDSGDVPLRMLAQSDKLPGVKIDDQ